MTKRTFIAGLVIAAVIAGGGVLLASNMGFKLNYALDAAGGGISVTGDNTISLPYNPQVGVVTAKNLIDDIGSGNVAFVQRYVESNNTLETYTGLTGSPNANWNLVQGEGYFVRMASTVNYIVVGSHDPTASIPMNAAGGGVSVTGDNFFSFPYHHTSATAKNLIDDIGSSDVAFVQRYVKSNNTLETYTGLTGSPNANWTMVPGEAYFVRMTNTVNYVPSHY